MLPRHYAPRTPLECVGTNDREHVEALCRAGRRVGWVTFAPAPEPSPPGLVVRGMPVDPAGYAAQIYAVLHELDGAGLDRIVVTLPPDAEEWLAVRDRLRRAGAR
jgi:L-threonylcarbamoyladenylate synthase